MEIRFEKTDYDEPNKKYGDKTGYCICVSAFGHFQSIPISREKLIKLRDKLTKLIQDRRTPKYTVANCSSIFISFNVN